MIETRGLGYVRYKVAKNLRKRGLWGTLQVCLRKLVDIARKLTPSYRRGVKADFAFDTRHGVETERIVTLDDLDVANRSEHCNWYQATPAANLTPILSRIPVPFGTVTFVDIGSGMGRVLLLASELPFRKIVGVEFSHDLHEIAQRNIANFRSGNQRCSALEPVCADALTYSLPETPLVLYLFNPFEKPLMDQFAKNVRASWLSNPRPIYIAYNNPVTDSFDRCPECQLLAEDAARPGAHAYKVYRWDGEAWS